VAVGISPRDAEHPVDRLFICLRKQKVISNITTEETKQLIAALSRNPSTKLVNISLLCQIWSFWHTIFHSGKENVHQTPDFPNVPSSKELYQLLRLKYENFLYVLELMHERPLLGIPIRVSIIII
jgi:hypothetical protein